MGFSAACQKPIELNPPPPPAERLVCAELPTPPRIEGIIPYQSGEGYVYDKGQVDARDAKVARYILQVRDAWFECSTQLAWLRDYYAAQD